MPKLDEETQHNLDILKALNYALENGPWEHNLFFKATGKKLEEIRDWFQSELHLEEIAKTGLDPEATKLLVKRQLMVEVFLSIYNANGTNINKWLNTITSVASHNIINRPIYSTEEAARSTIRSSASKQNEAYITVYIQRTDILPQDPDHIPTDRSGNKLLNIREKAIQLPNIDRFVHISGEYKYENNRLLRQSSVDFL